MSNSAIPEKISAYNVYNEGQRLIGVSGEIELPKFEQMTSTVSGAGILGEVDSPNIGHFSSMQLVIPMRVPTEEAVALYEPKVQIITLRANMQSMNISGGVIDHRPLKVTVRGMPGAFTPGKLKAGEATETEVSIEIYYIKIELDGKTLIELDKFGYVFVLNGTDYLASVKKNI